jgi:hypothetical protein
LLVIYLNCKMMHGLTNLKDNLTFHNHRDRLKYSL